MDNGLIVVTQLPVIEEKLRSVKLEIQEYVSGILSMECNEETYKEIKKYRSEMNARFKELEQKRKQVKTQIEGPYKAFEAVYKDCIADVFSAADKELAGKIHEIEEVKKSQKRENVMAFFNEYRESIGVPAEFVTYEKAGITITLSASEKSLKDQAKAFLDRVKDDLDLIATQEFKYEIYAEYKNSLVLSRAITTVTHRHKEIERQKELARKAEEEEVRKQKVEEETMKLQEEILNAKEEVLEIPKVLEAEPEDADTDTKPADAGIAKICFRVIAPISKLKELKQFLIEGGYDYANINDPDNQ